MIAIVCAFLSAVGFYFSLGLGSQWWLAWLAPVPVLWFAFGATKPWPIFFAAFAAMALGLLHYLLAYGGTMPTVPVHVPRDHLRRAVGCSSCLPFRPAVLPA